MIEVKHLEKGFQKKQVLKDVKFNIPSGECTALIGKNGAGKSTLTDILIGDLERNRGTIRDSPHLLDKEHLGILFQTSQFPKVMKVKELYHLYAKIVKNPFSLKQFQDITHFTKKQLNQFANQLSGGQQRILAFALAIIGRPKLLIMDEPTSAMDVEMRSHFWNVIERLKQQGTTIFYTSHYIEEVERMADRIIVLDKGVITIETTPQDLKQTQHYSVISVPKSWAKHIIQLQSVKSIQQDKLLHITTDNVETTLKELMTHHINLNEIEITKASLLETIFYEDKEREDV